MASEAWFRHPRGSHGTETCPNPAFSHFTTKGALESPVTTLLQIGMIARLMTCLVGSCQILRLTMLDILRISQSSGVSTCNAAILQLWGEVSVYLRSSKVKRPPRHPARTIRTNAEYVMNNTARLFPVAD
jgi:hypothetical protein